MPDGAMHLHRTRFQEHYAEQHIVERCLAPEQRVLVDAQRDKCEVDVVLFVGGRSRFLMVQRAVTGLLARHLPRSLRALRATRRALSGACLASSPSVTA